MLHQFLLVIWSEARISEFLTIWLSSFKSVNYKMLFRKYNVKQLTPPHILPSLPLQCIPSPLPIVQTCTSLSKGFLWLLKPFCSPLWLSRNTRSDGNWCINTWTLIMDYMFVSFQNARWSPNFQYDYIWRYVGPVRRW